MLAIVEVLQPKIIWDKKNLTVSNIQDISGTASPISKVYGDKQQFREVDNPAKRVVLHYVLVK